MIRVLMMNFFTGLVGDEDKEFDDEDMIFICF